MIANLKPCLLALALAGWSAGPLSAQIPDAPANLQVTAVSPTEALLTWSDISTNETKFRLERAALPDGPWRKAGTAAANASEKLLRKLKPTTTYYFRVAASNKAGASDYSNLVVLNPPAPPPDTTAPLVNLTNPQPNQIIVGTLDLTATATDSGGVARVEFYVDDQLAGSVTNEPFVFPWTSANVDDGLHTVQAKATDFSDNTGTSATVSIIVSNVPVVAAPSGLTATAQSTTTITVAWTDNSDNETGFELERAPTADGPWELRTTLTAGSQQFTDTGLEAGREYFYRVRACLGCAP
jgi:predicted phage tail protein